MSNPAQHENEARPPAIPRQLWNEIARVLSTIRYGSIEIVIHGGRVVQVESREKVRIADDTSSGS